jgi:hypothetical protein
MVGLGSHAASESAALVTPANGESVAWPIRGLLIIIFGCG